MIKSHKKNTNQLLAPVSRRLIMSSGEGSEKLYDSIVTPGANWSFKRNLVKTDGQAPHPLARTRPKEEGSALISVTSNTTRGINSTKPTCDTLFWRGRTSLTAHLVRSAVARFTWHSWPDVELFFARADILLVNECGADGLVLSEANGLILPFWIGLLPSEANWLMVGFCSGLVLREVRGLVFWTGLVLNIASWLNVGFWTGLVLR